MWRVLKIGLVVYVIANIILVWMFWHRIDQFIRFMPSVEAPEFPEAESKREKQKQDITYLGSILNYDRSFSDSEKPVFREKVAELLEAKVAVSDAEFYLGLREAMAIADNGHTGVEQAPAFRAFNRAGIDPYWFADGLFVVRAHKEQSSLLGSQIIEIEGQPVSSLSEKLGRYTGGAPSWRKIMSLYFMRSPELLHAAALAAAPDKLEVTLSDDTGKITKTTLDALPSIQESEFYFRHPFLTLAPVALQDEGDDWVRTLDEKQDKVAPYLKDIFAVHQASVSEGNLYLRSNYLMESPENPIEEQLSGELQKAPAGGFKNIIVDLRWNPGGDYGNAVPFAKNAVDALAKDGKIYVITSPNSFSAAIVFAALLKQSGGDRTVILGEPMGDHGQFWAERGDSFILPNSGYHISYSTGYHDWEKGCADSHEFCFTPNHRYEADIGSLKLDKQIAPTYKEYAAGRDIPIEWVLKKIAGKAP